MTPSVDIRRQIAAEMVLARWSNDEIMNEGVPIPVRSVPVRFANGVDTLTHWRDCGGKEQGSGAEERIPLELGLWGQPG